MNYLLYNPKANNSRNDINIIDKSTGERKLKKMSLLTMDIPAFLKSLTETDRIYICGGDGTLNKSANNTYGFEFPCDGAVCEEADRIKEVSEKKINYTTIAVGQILHKFKRPTARVTFNGRTKIYRNVWIASAMKGRFYGGGMMVAPTQDRTSGLITASIFHGGTRIKTLTVLPKIYKGRHIEHKEMVDFFPVEEMKVEFDIPTALQIDGDTISGVLSYTVRTAKKHEEYLARKKKSAVR